MVIDFDEARRAAQQRTIEALRLEWSRQLNLKRALLGPDDGPDATTFLGGAEAEDRDI
jgi:hypothetical protein